MDSKKSNKYSVTPFDIVLFLTLFCFFIAIIHLNKEGKTIVEGLVLSLGFWKDGFFGLLDFTLQMMMILVFGYALAVFKPIHQFLKKISSAPNSKVSAVLFVGVITMVSGLFNWGFGLIVGALLARFVSKAMQEKGVMVHPALLGAAGYLGMAVWHGGLSGSAPLKVAEEGHFLESSIGIISVDQTIFTNFNLIVTAGLLLVFMLTLYLLSKKNLPNEVIINSKELSPIAPGKSGFAGLMVGIAMILAVVVQFFIGDEGFGLEYVNLNWMNFILFALVLIIYRNLSQFTKATLEGLKNSVDIFIQFPFYAGILGLVTYSGLLGSVSQFFLNTTNGDVFPFLALTSSAIVNLMVPSGGGQWAVQGPIIMEVAKNLNLDSGKMILVFAYGDQISNLLQPFWALPLLAITGLSARELLRYTGWLFLAGFTFLVVVVFFFF
ncbi:TIGR00366 family protein [Algoriphagus zhangzhouensis]|uniref:Short-chain fatty acids transporter n=1 Tax=Algoriphagus zhangzhouensis TaxID=1073327 RepID=A0A1M7Z3F6_9BACT|nr:TIGR00366 family protein [Algoriphagus zhangzhouensis]TDY48396.1 short-chain fatty acids transporter [Algoriphagus zhangzhouensis]SHO59443.1 short-chain fatty acids transporter [Algoriphagus zhangzhouensis]